MLKPRAPAPAAPTRQAKRLSQFAQAAASVVAMACVLGAAAAPASAQEFGQARIATVTRAADVVLPPVARVMVGTTLAFQRLPTAAAARIAGEGFQIRIFTVEAPGAMPEPAARIGDCNLYFSTVQAVGPTTGPDIVFREVDASWLELSNSGKSIQDGHYRLVFEKRGPDAPLFRLKASDADRYFEQGFDLAVGADGKVTLEQVASLFNSRKAGLVQLQAGVSSRGAGVPCYAYQRYAQSEPAEDESPLVARLERCAAPASGAPGF